MQVDIPILRLWRISQEAMTFGAQAFTYTRMIVFAPKVRSQWSWTDTNEIYWHLLITNPSKQLPALVGTTIKIAHVDGRSHQIRKIVLFDLTDRSDGCRYHICGKCGQSWQIMIIIIFLTISRKHQLCKISFLLMQMISRWRELQTTSRWLMPSATG